MRKQIRALLALALVLSLWASTVAAPVWARTFSNTGGSPQQLSALLATNSFPGALNRITELTIYNPAAATIYFGLSDCSAANGAPIPTLNGYTFRSGGQGDDNIDPQSIYLFSAATQNVTIIIRSR